MQSAAGFPVSPHIRVAALIPFIEVVVSARTHFLLGMIRDD